MPEGSRSGSGILVGVGPGLCGLPGISLLGTWVNRVGIDEKGKKGFDSSGIHRRLLRLQAGATRRGLREGKEWKMRRAVLGLTVMGALLFLVSGIALAATIMCSPGATTCQGTPQDDYITGTAGVDNIYANSGNDTVYAEPGDDYVRGGSGRDELVGDAELSPGNDRIYGDSGDDVLSGENGSDYLNGGRDDDTIYALRALGTNLEGRDTIRGGTGDDVIYANDGVVDNIDCGTGTDEVTYDSGIDVVAADCEDLFPQ